MPQQNRNLVAALFILLLIALPGRAAQPFHVTAEQEAQVREAVHHLRGSGLMQPLKEAPKVEGWETVLVSDAVSVVELAWVDFRTRIFYLNVKNPWTLHQDWYGPFSLDVATQGPEAPRE